MKKNQPDYLFEVSWEVCNKIGGIHTLITTKANLLSESMNDNYICIGPDVWKETHGNPEFVEDKYLYRSWRKEATKEGLHFRIGRWNIPGEPIVILVDFTPFFSDKNDIFTDLWLKFKLNSLSGQWDYTEPALFGYSAGKVIESFYNYYLSSKDRFIAQFHEWMTGSGVLYLKDKVPQAATVFTTHATALGRGISSEGIPLYSQINNINGEEKARELNILSKHSMEQTAGNNADVFTTVSGLSAKESHKLLGKEPDLITPNGFNNNFVPEEKEFVVKRKKAREKLFAVASGMINQPIKENSLLMMTSGRYEFRNKGYDLFIEMLGKLNQMDIDHQVVAFMLIPANQTGVKPDVIKRVDSPDFNHPVEREYTTHKLVDESNDEIIKALKSAGLNNAESDKVKVVFLPAYLNGTEGVIDLNYYDTLIGFDLTLFPSLYEPWGYTPLESLAFRIPTVTSSLVGFGAWVKEKFPDQAGAIKTFERDQQNYHEISYQIAQYIKEITSDQEFGNMTADDQGFNSYRHSSMIELSEMAAIISQEITWQKLVDNYLKAFELAMERVQTREEQFKLKKPPVKTEYLKSVVSKPKWKKILIEISIPDELKGLQKLSRNLWWTWNYDAKQLFEKIDPELWEKCEKSPPKLLDNLTLEHYKNLLRNNDYMSEYTRVIQKFDDYMKKGEEKNDQSIAYFSMEYGLHSSVKIYSGGLGVLAGDFLKQASDDNINMVGIGLAYRFGYFSQNLSLTGEQMALYNPHNFTYMSAQPVRDENGEWVKISIAFPGRNVYAKVWRIDVGRTPLFLLDTDITENNSMDRSITHQLYGGDWENRFKQEFLLGIGGIRLLDALGLHPRVFHLNEGHAAFAGLERLRKFVQDEKLTFEEAMEMVRASSLFTTHTPVPAGHDFFSEDMLRTYMPHYADRLGIKWETFMSLGKIHTENPQEQYSMSVLATKLASQVNGVSKIHGKVSRDMFKDLYPGYFKDEVHIGHVTNGVHYGTWVAPEWQKLYQDTFGECFADDVSLLNCWEKIYNVPDEKIWTLRQQQRQKLMDYIKKRLLSNLSRRQEAPRKVYQTLEALNPNALTIGFARRFATYKRAGLLFNDLEKLARIVNKTNMPVQFLYAGKAHPADKAGQELIKHIVDVSKRKEFVGKVIFLEDYDMELGEALVKGVDIWLNTPTRPLEASGTSGQKASLNGVMNFSVLDGWWAEGYTKEAGWAIKEEKTYDNQVFQDELDAEIIYNTLENEIIPLFYERNETDIPLDWVKWIKNNIAKIAPVFTNKRMMDDYMNYFYHKLFDKTERLQNHGYAIAKELARWKSKIIQGWDSVEVVSRNVMNTADKSLLLGESFSAELVLNLNGFNESDLGVEIVFSQKTFEGEDSVISIYEMEQTNKDDETVTFRCQVPTQRVGIYNYAFRLFPKHDLLSHRQDLKLVKWF